MKRILRHRPSPGTVLGLTALVVAIGGAAFAAIPDSSGTIHGCFHKSNGNLRVVDSASDCRTNETAIEWNQQGAPGGALAYAYIGPEGPDPKLDPSRSKNVESMVMGAGGTVFFGPWCFKLAFTARNVQLTQEQFGGDPDAHIPTGSHAVANRAATEARCPSDHRSAAVMAQPPFHVLFN